MSTGGATMPRRMLTIRSVPPPSSWPSGCAARAASTSPSVVGRSSCELGQRLHQAPPLRLAPSRARAARFSIAANTRSGVTGRSLKRMPGGVGDGVGERRQEGGERALARLLGAERPVRVVALDDADLDRRRVLDGRHAVVEHVGR